MKKFMQWAGLALGLGFSVASSAQVTAPQFQQWMNDTARETAAQVTASQTEAQREHARQARYVFVNGFLGEAFRHAFQDMMHTLQDLGVPKSHIFKLVPASSNNMDQNLAFLKGKLAPILEGNNDPIVIVGHSRGAVESLAYVLSAPKEVRDRVHGLYLVNGAFGGSPLADWVAGKGVPMDDRLPSWVRTAMERVQKLDLGRRIPELEKLTGMEFGEGLLSLTHDAQTEFWTRHVSQNRAAADELNSRIFYIRGYDTPLTMKWAFKLFGYYMDIYYGANDGIVPYDYQAIEGLGTTLVTLRESHNSLITGTDVTRTMLTTRRAVTDAIFLGTGEE